MMMGLMIAQISFSALQNRCDRQSIDSARTRLRDPSVDHALTHLIAPFLAYALHLTKLHLAVGLLHWFSYDG